MSSQSFKKRGAERSTARYARGVSGSDQCGADASGRAQDRLQSTKPMLLLLPPALVAYAWTVEKKIHVSAACLLLFLIGFSSMYARRRAR